MSLEKEVREVLGEAAVQYKKLDQLVRQGMMSPAALPILHRGLDKMQAGQVLNPQEREAVNKVLQSMLYIVTGDDTVFQKARQHTQKTRYQTEDAAVEEGAMSRIDYQQKSGEKGSGLETFKKKPAEKKKFPANTSATQGKRMGGTAKMYGEEAVEETEQLDEYGNYSVGIKGQGGTTVKARSDKEASQKAFKNMGIADRHRKTMSHTVKKVGEETEVEENVTSTVKKPVKNTLIANPKTQKVRKVTPSRAKMAVKKGFVYAEEWTDEELDSLFEMDYKAKFAAMLKKTGKSLESMSDEEKKKFFNSVDTAHQAKNEEVNEGSYPDSEEMRVKAQRKLTRLSKMAAKKEKETDPGYKEETEIEEDAASDARRAMRSDSKGMAPLKKDKKTTYSGAKPGEERHGGHIVMQLRKAVSIGKPVKFKDGKEHKVSKADAHKFLSKYNSQKPADREKMHSGHDSHDSFQSHINNK